MAIDLTAYLPNSIIVAAGTVAAWVFRDHAQRDDLRFKAFGSGMQELSRKIDRSAETQAANHAEILKILLEQKNG